MKRILIAALAAVSLFFIIAQHKAVHSATTDEKLKGSYRFEKSGWIYVHIEGSPERMGYQHGYLLANEIADLLRTQKPFLLKTTKRDWDFYRQAAEKMLWPKIEEEYQREIDGIVAGATARGAAIGKRY